MTDATIINEKSERVAVGKLTAHPANPRHGDLDSIKNSIQTNGFYGVVVAQRSTGYVLAGNHRLQAAAELGFAKVPVVWLDVNDERALRILLADNRTNDVAGYDEQALAELLQGLADTDAELAGTGYDGEALTDLLAKLAGNDRREDVEPAKQDDGLTTTADELQQKWQTEVGQTWSVGTHTLVIGDSTDVALVASVMADQRWSAIVTDPPYGVEYEGGTNTKKRRQIAGDADASLYQSMLEAWSPLSADAAPIYAWFAGSKGAAVYQAIEAAGFQPRAMIVWNKLNAHYGAFMSHYMPKHEPCLYAVKGSASWYGPTNEVTVWDIEQPSRNEYHPTEKPVECMARPIRNSTAPGDIVVDPFVGSGTTMVACEQLGRTCIAFEIDPGFAAVVLDRMSSNTDVTIEQRA